MKLFVYSGATLRLYRSKEGSLKERRDYLIYRFRILFYRRTIEYLGILIFECVILEREIL